MYMINGQIALYQNSMKAHSFLQKKKQMAFNVEEGTFVDKKIQKSYKQI